MSSRLAGRTVVVTGGGSGIGQACVLASLRDGANVVFCDLSATAIEQTTQLAKAEQFEARVRSVQCDVTSEQAVHELMDYAVAEFGDLHVVLNNAGHGMSVDSVTELSVEDWDRAFRLLARAPFVGTKHGARAMRAAGHGGAIVNMSSIAGLSAGAGPLAYSSAKAAVINFTRAAAVELAPDQIRVNSISPGLILTPLNAYKGTEPEQLAETAEFFSTIQPLPEHGRAEHIAAGFVFLASDEARWVTGHNLVIDGGNSVHNLISRRVYEWIEQTS